MRNMVFLAFLALLGFAIAGWYLDWYTVAGAPGKNGHTRIEIEVDSQKIKDDTEKFIDKSKAKLHDSLEKTQENEAAAKSGPPAEKEKLAAPKPPI